MPTTIKIDTREQLPYDFDNAETGKLDCGDYTICGAESMVAIERKTADDLVSSLSYGREPFERELFKSRAYDYFALVIEASLQDIVSGRYHSEMNPASVVQSLVAFSVRYRLPVWFAGCREYGQRLTESLLTKYCRELEKRFTAVSGG